MKKVRFYSVSQYHQPAMLRRMLLSLFCVQVWIGALAIGSDVPDTQPDHSLLPESYSIGAPDDSVDWSRHPCRRDCRGDRESLNCRYGLTVEIDVPDTQPGHSLLPESYGIGAPDDSVDWSRHPCRRDCRGDREPLTCRYGLTVEMYASMSKACYDCPYNVTDCFRPHCVTADGGARVVVVANRRLPGLLIEVCRGDRLLVDVTNELGTDTMTIHWHGLHQRGSPFMDGVPYVSQCPILPGKTFRYDFRVERAGSFIWHSHSTMQRTDGLSGGLIVRSSDEENSVASVLYDRDEHMIVVNEWTRNTGSHSLVLHRHTGKQEIPHTILINGLGRFVETKDKKKDERQAKMPVEVLHVEKGNRYRFRLMNVGSEVCPMFVSVDDHPMLVISTDGADIEPVEVDSIRILSGERYDFVLTADRPIDNYWMRFRGGEECTISRSYQVAILRYGGAPIAEPKADPDDPTLPDGPRQMNPPDKGTETADAISIATLKSLEPDDISLMREPDHQFYISADGQRVDNYNFHRKNLYGFYQVRSNQRYVTMQMNFISFKFPNFPLQTQPELIAPDQFCNTTTADSEMCENEYCSCSQAFEAKLGSVVELVIIDPGTAPTHHAMHLHGYYYRVIAMEKVNETLTTEQVKRMDREGKIRRRLKSAPLKDTVDVPSGGYTIVRFHADNPGYWIFHCHFEMHSTNGMASIIKVGEHKDFPKVPKNFPKC